MVAHIYNGILLRHKKEQNNAICNNTDATRDAHTKGTKSERERQIPDDITCMWNLYNTAQMNLSTEQKQTHRLVVAKGEGVGWMWNSGLVDANYYI